jgi:glycosyltransferase involved in cell wall biosynthesis
MARAAVALEFDVAIATRVSDRADLLRGEGLTVIPLGGRRGRIGPLALVAEIMDLFRVIRGFRPDLLHLIALKPVLLGGLVGRIIGVRAILCAVTGQGYLAAAEGPRAAFLRAVVSAALTWLFRSPRAHLLLENAADAAPYAAKIPGLAARCTQVGGAGVDPDNFPATPLPEHQPPVAALVARMLWSKGADLAVAAQQALMAEGKPLTLRLVGAPDPENPRAVPLQTLEAWSKLPGVEWLGPRSDIAAVWRDADIALIPSRGGEGLPRALLEAASSGRPIVTTDVPGCRDFVRDGLEGRVVAPGSAEALAAALSDLLADPARRAQMGLNARKRLLDGYTETQVAGVVATLYQSLTRTA